MNKDFKVWASDRKEILKVLLWLKKNDYHLRDSGDGFSCELIHTIAKNKSQCGFVVYKEKRVVYISPVINYNFFTKCYTCITEELTFDEFEKQYLEGNKMKERKVSSNLEDMPKLETGMFVENQEGEIGIVVDNKIVYQSGGYDVVNDGLYQDEWITSVYKKTYAGFNDLKNNEESYLVWSLKTCIEISKKEIAEKFDLIDSEYLEIIVTNPPYECNTHPVLQNGDFIHSVNSGWGVVVGNNIVYKERGFDYVDEIAHSEEIDAVDRMAFSFEDCGNNKNMWHKTYHILESKFRKTFNIPDCYDFKIVD